MIGYLKKACPVFSAREASLDVSEEKSLEKCRRNSRTVLNYEGAVLSLAVLLYSPDNQFFSGAGLAVNQNS